MNRTLLLRSLPSPMLPALVERPFDSPEWLFETKWDGVRAICAVTRSETIAVSRTGRDLVRQFPELAKLSKAFKAYPTVIDGEIVSLDRKGRSSFQRLQPRINRLSENKDTSIAITFVAFDMLTLGTDDMRQEPLERRKQLLKKNLRAGASGVRYSEHVVRAGVRRYEKARSSGLEGIIAKRRDSPYRSGRSRDWLKIKVISSQEFVICGWTEPRGSRHNFGALLLGIYDGAKLVYAGHVGTGFDERSLSALHAKLKPLETKRCPFKTKPVVNAPVHWVRPSLVAEIKFSEWTRDGALRQPVYLGLRIDKRPKDCIRTAPAMFTGAAPRT